jgi:fructose-bisphosphate aldolase class II
MSLVTLSEILKDAHNRKYGVPMFDVFNLEMTRAVIEAAETERSPVIIALAEVHASKAAILDEIAAIMMYAAKNAAVPVCTHFDHGVTFENCLRALYGGFTSIMYDGSMLPYPDNTARTSEIKRIAGIFGVSVEGELGHVGNSEGEETGEDSIYTDPELAEDFIQCTGVDALAISIGTVHGVYKTVPKLDLDILKNIRETCSVPLVLHGGSGLSDKDFYNCIEAGISKINIYTELAQIACEHLLRRKNDGEEPDYRSRMQQSSAGMREYIRSKMRLFGSSGRG